MAHVKWLWLLLLGLLMSGLTATACAAAEPDPVQVLIGQLADQDQGYYAAMELADMGPKVIPAATKALESADPVTRRWAARVMTNLGKEKAASVGPAVMAALAKEKDPTASWYMVQCVGVLQPDPKSSVPLLAGILESGELNLKREVVDALGKFGPSAAPAKPALIKAMETDDDWLQLWAMVTLRQIGLDRSDTESLARAQVRDSSEGAREIFRDLLKCPDLAIRFVEAHPKLLAAMPENDLALMELFARHEESTTQLRQFLEKRPDLPPFIRVDFSKGERIGHVMTWPRDLDRTICFPQRLQVVRVVADRAVVDRFATDAKYKLWEGEGLVSLVIGRKWGYINLEGQIVIKPQFDHAYNFQEGLAVVIAGDKYGYIDKQGQYVVRPQFQWAYAFHSGLGAVKRDGKWGIVDRRGQWIKRPAYQQLEPSGGRLRAWTLDGREGVVDQQGNLILSQEGR